MLNILRARIQQKHRTIKFPDGPPPPLPERFRGRPVFEMERCAPDCRACAEACPTGAITIEAGKAPVVDLGKCLFCNDCARACPRGAISHASDYRLSASGREALIVEAGSEQRLADALAERLRGLLGRALRLRQVSAGGCNACEADCNVLTTVGWDLSRFGINFVASPRHADGLLVTGPVTRNMHSALMETYEAVAEPKIVIAVGACAVSGGTFAGHDEVYDGVGDSLPVDLFVPGCPPHPLTILDGLLRLIGRVSNS